MTLDRSRLQAHDVPDDQRIVDVQSLCHRIPDCNADCVVAPRGQSLVVHHLVPAPDVPVRVESHLPVVTREAGVVQVLQKEWPAQARPQLSTARRGVRAVVAHQPADRVREHVDRVHDQRDCGLRAVVVRVLDAGLRVAECDIRGVEQFLPHLHEPRVLGVAAGFQRLEVVEELGHVDRVGLQSEYPERGVFQPVEVVEVDAYPIAPHQHESSNQVLRLDDGQQVAGLFLVREQHDHLCVALHQFRHQLSTRKYQKTIVYLKPSHFVHSPAYRLPTQFQCNVY